jgi:predicted N-acyltransferase
MMDFDIQIIHSVQEIDQAAWDGLGNGRPFSSYRWYRFGEKVMRDCIPVYIILLQSGKMVARATFWVIRNEPLPISWRLLRKTAQAIFRHWPLFICRSPLSNTSGLVLPEEPLRQPALDQLCQAAKAEARKYKASFLLIDYINEEETKRNRWQKDFSCTSVPDPGTRMEIIWPDFDQYLAALVPKVRKHYRQYNREAEALGIKVNCQETITDMEAALVLISNVEQRHRSSPNPWARSILENANLVGAAWMTARQGERLVGCELILQDNGTQMVTSLGMADDFPHVYFLLGYADIRHAIEQRIGFLNWGSGAFEAKQRLGFELEDNNFVLFQGCAFFTKLVAGLI